MLSMRELPTRCHRQTFPITTAKNFPEGLMIASLEKPQLELIRGTSPEGKIEESPHSKFAVEEIKHSNQAEFERLEEEERWLTAAYTAAGGALAVSVVIPEPVTKLGSLLAGTVAAGWVLKRIQKINSILRNAKELDKVFADQQIQVFTNIPVPDQGRADLFIKFPLPPKKALFLASLASSGKATVIFHEEKAALYIRNKKKWKPWQPDPIERSARQEYWLRHNRQAEMFGTASRDKYRAVVKLLVLTGETKIGQHSEPLYTQVGDQRVLLLQKRSSIYVLEESQLLPFIKAWLA